MVCAKHLLAIAVAFVTGVAIAKRDDGLSEWNAKWQKIQQSPEALPLGDHWRVCEIQFRFRNYQELFHCLDLVEQRTAKLDEKSPQRRYAPVLTGWMRASAYGELGDSQKAVDWAELAWAALPDDYRDVSSSVFPCGYRFVLFCKKDEFESVTIEAGGSAYMAETNGEVGWNNPAGLDLRSQLIAMSLAAQRCMLHLRRGEHEQAYRAFRDLDRWRDSGHLMSGIFSVGAIEQALGPLYAMGQYSDVRASYKYLHGRTIFVNAGNRVGKALTYVMSAGLVPLVRYLTVEDARRFATALEEMSDRYLYASSLVRVGEMDEARQQLDEMLQDPELRDMGNLYWVTLYERSGLAREQGQREEAKRYLQQAVDAIERVRTTITFEAGKIGFATDKQAVYGELVGVLAEAGDWSGAFAVVERAKARALVDLLARVRELPPPPQAGEKVRQLIAQAAILQNGFALDEQQAQTRNLSVAARADLAQAAPEAASLVSVPSVALPDIAGRLEPGETLVSYFWSGPNLYALVMNGAAVTGVKLPAAGLAEQIRAYRKAIEAGDTAADAQGRVLYDRLIRPLADRIQGPRLTLCPHGALHYLPFAALLNGDQYLIDRYSLRVMPSASALVYLKTDKPQKAGRVLALGNPDLGDPKFDLPNAQAEAEQVAQMFPDSRALLRREASKTAVKEMGGSFSILHFASHAVFDADAPLASGLMLAKGQETDGRLTVSDLYGMRLDAQLVTLSACQTGLGKVASGDDVIGLTRGFFYAGARTIVASLWSVDDRATAELMVSFYQILQTTDQREALRQAQIRTRRNHPAPLYWAAFEITGSAN